MFHEIVVNILGFTKGKTWDDVRRELSDKQVKDIHGAFGCLWPPETNIVDLLYKPDKKVLRALYTGLIDPRIILRNVGSFSLYFDEIIVVNPFMNPANVKPEYSPVHSPSQYKQETLKNILLLMQLIPFIDAGIVNMVPDPCALNSSLRKQIWAMAEARLRHWKPEYKDMNPMKELLEDDVKRSMYGLSDESLKRNIKTASPDLSDEQVQSTFDYMKQKQLEDPLALLQQITPGQKGGQFLISHLSPNFELGFFLAQITGSFIYTDNQHRWGEITCAVNNVSQSQNSLWEPLTRYMNELDFTFEINPNFNLQMRQTGRMVLIRNVLRKIFMKIQSEQDAERIKSLARSLSDELRVAYEKSQIEWDSIQKKTKQPESGIPTATFKGRINCVIPSNGFGINSVHRLLLSYGSIKYLKSVPMAMFVRYDEK
jgi:hypothetical protein